MKADTTKVRPDLRLFPYAKTLDLFLQKFGTALKSGEEQLVNLANKKKTVVFNMAGRV